MENKTQNQKILSWLKRRRKLTAIKALRLFQCFRLASRIKDLKDAGNPIRSTRVKTPGGKWVAEYSLEK